MTMRKQGHNNIGLINTHKRVKLVYGEPYGVDVESEFGAGAKVTLHIPVDQGNYRMYNVMIVDDEPVIKKGLKCFIDWGLSM